MKSQTPARQLTLHGLHQVFHGLGAHTESCTFLHQDWRDVAVHVQVVHRFWVQLQRVHELSTSRARGELCQNLQPTPRRNLRGPTELQLGSPENQEHPPQCQLSLVPKTGLGETHGGNKHALGCSLPFILILICLT